MTGTNRTNILYLTVDCFRVDQYEAFDWLDAVPGGRLDCPECIATGPGTRTAFPGLLTSTFPMQAGGYNVVGPERTVIAAPLRAAGYATGAFHSNPNLRSDNGWDEGFDNYFDSIEGTRKLNDVVKLFLPDPVHELGKKTYLSLFAQDGIPYLRAEEVNNRAVEWIGEQTEPWFCWIHYMDLHHPYLPPEPYRDVDESEARRLWRLLNEDREAISDTDVETLWNLYTAETAYLAARVQSLLKSLSSRGDLENTVVVLTGDHGEEFREHGSLAHKEKLYDELVHVPLSFAGPSLTGTRTVESVVSAVDIPVTLLTEFGDESVDIPNSYRGQNVFDPSYDREGAFSEIAHSRERNISVEQLLVSYRTAEWKYILDSQRDSNELFNIDADPSETNDVAGANPTVESTFSDRIAAHIEPYFQSEVLSGDDQRANVEKRLEDLGYL